MRDGHILYNVVFICLMMDTRMENKQAVYRPSHASGLSLAISRRN